jgi:site-specific DNA-methyltransferase (adenine-specific)
MTSLRPGSVGCVVTSPPYNIGIGYGTHDDSMPRREYLAWMDRVAGAVARVLAPDGHLFLNVGFSGRHPWVDVDVAMVFRRHLVLQNRIAWVKSITVNDRTSGQFKPINSPRYLNGTWESLFHFSPSGDSPVDRLAAGVRFQNKNNISRFKGNAGDRRCRGNTWFVPYETVQNRSGKHDHPAPFPVRLAELCILLSGKQRGLVVDPFLGTGTTLVASERLGRRGVGFEIDPEYARTAVARIRDERRGRG